MESRNKNEVLKTLQCPFNPTWDGITTTVTSEKEFNPENDEQYFPVVMLMHNIMNACICAVNGDDFESLCAKLKKCYQVLEDVKEKQHKEISLKVVQHILEATELYVLDKHEKIEEFESQLQNITFLNEDRMNIVEKATFEACKSIVWSPYDLSKSISYMRKAVKYNADCDLWHLFLGKELRRERRDKNIRSLPSDEEFDSFKKAYELDHHPFCGVFLAQAYRERDNDIKADMIYNNMYEKGLEEGFDCFHKDIPLRLALGFIRFKDFLKAKRCLDHVAVTNPNHPLYCHYQGIYYKGMGLYYNERKQFEKAVPYLEKSITDKHLAVVKDYLFCKAKADESIDSTEYILGLLEKYPNFLVNIRQHLLLELAISYAKKKDADNVIKAIEFFTEAVNLDPKSSILKYFDCCTDSTRKGNVYWLLQNKFLPKVYQNFQTDSDVIDAADILQKLTQ